MMELKSQRISRSEIFRDHIERILKDQGTDTDDEWWEDEEAWEELGELAWGDRDYVSNSKKLKIESRERLVFAVYRKDKNALFHQIEEQAGLMAQEPETEGIHLVFFVQDMRNQAKLETCFSHTYQAKLTNQIRENTGKKNPSVKCTYILEREDKKQSVRLYDLRRYEIMQMPPVSARINMESSDKEQGENQEGSLHGLVFTARLYQLVDIYNMIGDQLFNDNVRFGINEILGVDQAICRTLEEEPEHFWYKNNGITILVRIGKADLRKSEVLTLDELEPGKDPSFSIINGAQTITASAKCFFNMELQREEDRENKDYWEKKLEKSKRAQVLVRVIYLPREEGAGSGSLGKEISVALNRQKPIKMEDIAFTTYQVTKTARYLEREMKAGRGDFSLVRRGEGILRNRQLELISFVRARKACWGEPGEARSKGANELLKLKIDEDGNYVFYYQDIFVKEWTEAEERQEDQVFKRFYGAVWFADQLARRYEKEKRQIKKEEPEILTAVRNGKWYFTAALIQVLNGFAKKENSEGRMEPDYSGFGSSVEDVEGNLLQGIVSFAQIVATYARIHRDEYGELDSNLFKKSDCYEGLMEAMEQVYKGGRRTDIVWKKTEEETVLTELLTDFCSLFVPGVFEENASEINISQQEAAMTAVEEFLGEKYVIFGRTRVRVKSMAEAMGKTVEYILTQYPQGLDGLEEYAGGWITSDSEKAWGSDGYFAGAPRAIKVGGATYWIGTLSNTGRKTRQVREMCRQAGVKRGEIAWYDSDGNKVFGW